MRQRLQPAERLERQCSPGRTRVSKCWKGQSQSLQVGVHEASVLPVVKRHCKVCAILESHNSVPCCTYRDRVRMLKCNNTTTVEKKLLCLCWEETDCEGCSAATFFSGSHFAPFRRNVGGTRNRSQSKANGEDGGCLTNGFSSQTYHGLHHMVKASISSSARRRSFVRVCTTGISRRT